MSQIVFMGLILNKYDVRPKEEKVKTNRETKAPTNVAELRSFLGLVSFSARFLPVFSTTVEPLRKLTRQGTCNKMKDDQDKTKRRFSIKSTSQLTIRIFK